MNVSLRSLEDIPQEHRGVLFEQLHLAATGATFLMRGLGLSLPGDTKVPTHQDVYEHLCKLTVNAIEGYEGAREAAPDNIVANDILGEDEDDLFYVEVTGITRNEKDGYAVSVDLNILYR